MVIFTTYTTYPDQILAKKYLLAVGLQKPEKFPVTMYEASTVAGPNGGCPSHCPSFDVAQFSLPTVPTREWPGARDRAEALRQPHAQERRTPKTE